MCAANNPSADSATNRLPWIWLLTLVVAGLPVVFVLYQITIFFREAFPHLYWSRTLPSLAAVALGLAGIAVPCAVWIKRTSFRRWSGARQGTAIGGVLLVVLFLYLLPFLLLIEAGRNSRAILEYTPTVVLTLAMGGEDRLSWGVIGGPGTGHGSASGSSRGSGPDHVLGPEHVLVEWQAPLEPLHLPRSKGPAPLVHLRAEGSLDPIKLDVQIENGRKVVFKSIGIRNATIRRENQLVTLPVELEAGSHGFTIEATP